MMILLLMLAFTQEYTGPVGLDRIPNFAYVDQLQDHVSDHNDPLLLIQVTNDLIPLGTEEAMRRIDKYAKSHDDSDQHRFLEWLARVLFVGKQPGYSFGDPHIGAVNPKLPADFSTWPLFPLYELQSIPFNMFAGAKGTGTFALFECNRDEWTIRHSKLVPPDDPFVCDKRPPNLTISVSDHSFKEQVHAEIIRLVRTAYRIDRSGLKYINDDNDFELAHKDFLKLGCHWNRYLNCYVRRDGIYDLDVFYDLKVMTCRFPQMDNLKISVLYNRETDGSLYYDPKYVYSPGQRVRPAVLVIRDYKTKAELAWYAINGPEIKHLSKLTWRKALRAKPFKNIGTGDQSGGFLHLSKGQQIRFSVYYDDEEYKSPVLKP